MHLKLAASAPALSLVAVFFRHVVCSLVAVLTYVMLQGAAAAATRAAA
jgi:hypothetical protein